MAEAYIKIAKDLLSAVRRVKSGDIILPQDINTLVDIVQNILKALQAVEIIAYSPLFLSIGTAKSPGTPRTLPASNATSSYSAIYINVDYMIEPFIETAVFN